MNLPFRFPLASRAAAGLLLAAAAVQAEATELHVHVGVQPVNHAPARHWVPGHWQWQGHARVWVPGYWAVTRPPAYGHGWHRPPAYAYGPGHGYRRDRDRDGIPDRWDHDRDNDGRPNHRDRDRDGDGVPNRHDLRPDDPYRH